MARLQRNDDCQLTVVDDLARVPRIDGDLVPVVALVELDEGVNLRVQVGHVEAAGARARVQHREDLAARFVVDRRYQHELEPRFVRFLEPGAVHLLVADVEVVRPVGEGRVAAAVPVLIPLSDVERRAVLLPGACLEGGLQRPDVGAVVHGAGVRQLCGLVHVQVDPALDGAEFPLHRLRVHAHLVFEFVERVEALAVEVDGDEGVWHVREVLLEYLAYVVFAIVDVEIPDHARLLVLASGAHGDLGPDAAVRLDDAHRRLAGVCRGCRDEGAPAGPHQRAHLRGRPQHARSDGGPLTFGLAIPEPDHPIDDLDRLLAHRRGRAGHELEWSLDRRRAPQRAGMSVVFLPKILDHLLVLAPTGECIWQCHRQSQHNSQQARHHANTHES